MESIIDIQFALNMLVAWFASLNVPRAIDWIKGAFPSVQGNWTLAIKGLLSVGVAVAVAVVSGEINPDEITVLELASYVLTVFLGIGDAHNARQ